MPKTFQGFGESLVYGSRPAVLVVDFINGFTNPECKLGSNLDKEVHQTRLLLDEARKHQLPVIFTTVIYEPHYLDGGCFVEKVPALKCLLPGSEWVEIDPRLQRRTETEPLIIKKYASSFFGTTLSSLLAYQKADTLIITGCTTSGCVRATVVDAMQHGYRPVVPEECVGDRSQEAHRANLYDIQTKYGEVTSVKKVHQYFRELHVRN